jgi:vacuolar fusion protein MON1
LQSQPTTALSSIDIQTVSFPDGSRGTFSISSDHPNAAFVSGSRKVSQKSSEIDDNASLTSYGPSLRVGGDLESLLGNGFNMQSPVWKLLNSQTDSGAPFETIEFDEDDRLSSFEHEFDEVADIDSKEGNEG